MGESLANSHSEWQNSFTLFLGKWKSFLSSVQSYPRDLMLYVRFQTREVASWCSLAHTHCYSTRIVLLGADENKLTPPHSRLLLHTTRCSCTSTMWITMAGAQDVCTLLFLLRQHEEKHSSANIPSCTESCGPSSFGRSQSVISMAIIAWVAPYLTHTKKYFLHEGVAFVQAAWHFNTSKLSKRADKSNLCC